MVSPAKQLQAERTAGQLATQQQRRRQQRRRRRRHRRQHRQCQLPRRPRSAMMAKRHVGWQSLLPLLPRAKLWGPFPLVACSLSARVASGSTRRREQGWRSGWQKSNNKSVCPLEFLFLFVFAPGFAPSPSLSHCHPSELPLNAPVCRPFVQIGKNGVVVVVVCCPANVTVFQSFQSFRNGGRARDSCRGCARAGPAAQHVPSDGRRHARGDVAGAHGAHGHGNQRPVGPLSDTATANTAGAAAVHVVRGRAGLGRVRVPIVLWDAVASSVVPFVPIGDESSNQPQTAAAAAAR